MGIGVSIFLLALGAILAFAVNATINGLDIARRRHHPHGLRPVGLALLLTHAGLRPRRPPSSATRRHPRPRRPRPRRLLAAAVPRPGPPRGPGRRRCPGAVAAVAASPRALRRRGRGRARRAARRTGSTSRTGMPQSCWVMWQAGCSTPSSQQAAVAATCRTPSPPPASTSARDSPGPAPAPSASSSGGDALTTSRVAGPSRSSRCWPGGGSNTTSSAHGPGRERR